MDVQNNIRRKHEPGHRQKLRHTEAENLTFCWWDLPNPGMFAAAQRILGLNFDTSIVVSEEHSPVYQVAQQLGMAFVSGRALFQQTAETKGWSAMSRLRRHVRRGAQPADEWLFTRFMAQGTIAHLEEDDPDLALPQAECAGCWWQSLVGSGGNDHDGERAKQSQFGTTDTQPRRLPSWMMHGGIEEDDDDDDDIEDAGTRLGKRSLENSPARPVKQSAKRLAAARAVYEEENVEPILPPVAEDSI